jgi:type I restriction enzyme M protein
VIRGNEGLDPGESFEELSKVLFAKLLDEIEVSAGTKAGLELVPKTVERPEVTARLPSTVRELFLRGRVSFDNVFDGLPKSFLSIRLNDETLDYVARAFQGFSLRGTSIDVKGSAFELMVKDTFTGRGLGQFFTPREVVQFVVDILRPLPEDLLIDPACGSGGFLIGALQKVRTEFGEAAAKLFLEQGVNGVDINPRMAWVTRMNMVMHGDGHGRILSGNSLSVPSTNQMGLPSQRLLGSYSVVVTNPPFGAKITDQRILESFELGKGRRSRQVEVLFVELCIKLAKPGGRVAIVVPDGVLTNPGETDLRRLIEREAVISAVVKLPEETFMPFGSSASSSVIFLKRRSKDTKPYPLFVAVPRSVGFDKNGTPTSDNDLPTIVERFSKARESLSLTLPRILGGSPATYLVPPPAPGERLDAVSLGAPETRIKPILEQSNKLVRLGTLVKLVNGSTDPGSHPTDSFSYVGLAQVSSHTGTYRIERMAGDTIRSRCWNFRKGDILFARLRPNLRKVACVDQVEGGICSSEFYVLRVVEGNDPHLVAAFLRSDAAYLQYSHLVTGIGRPRLAIRDLLDLRVPASHRELVSLCRAALKDQTKVADLLKQSEKLWNEADELLIRSNAEIARWIVRVAEKPSERTERESENG